MIFALGNDELLLCWAASPAATIAPGEASSSVEGTGGILVLLFLPTDDSLFLFLLALAEAGEGDSPPPCSRLWRLDAAPPPRWRLSAREILWRNQHYFFSLVGREREVKGGWSRVDNVVVSCHHHCSRQPAPLLAPLTASAVYTRRRYGKWSQEYIKIVSLRHVSSRQNWQQ